MRVLKFNIPNLNKDNAEEFEAAVLACPGVKQVNTWPNRAELTVEESFVQSHLETVLQAKGFTAVRTESAEQPTVVTKVHIDGMTCRSCEITIERQLKKLPGITKVTANAASGTIRLTSYGEAPHLSILEEAIGDSKYKVTPHVKKEDRNPQGVGQQTNRPTIGRLTVLFASVAVLGWILSKLGLFSPNYNIGSTVGFSAALVLGLVAGSSSCLAVAGGLLLSSAGKFNERYGNLSFLGRMQPVGLFVVGRILSYGFLGGLIGLLGKSLTPSPLIVGSLTVLAAVYMLTMGLDMLHIAPRWLKSLMPRMPKGLSHRIMDAEGNDHWATPFLLGAATFFLPCGFTQSLQLYALTTGSFMASAITLAGFALGTAPALFALGWASTSLKGKFGKLFLQFSGALVIVLGLWNVQNGFTITGYPLSFPNISLGSDSAGVASASAANINDPNVAYDGTTSLIRMKIGVDPFYSPSDQYTVRAGHPVRMEITGQATGCRSVFQIPRLGVQAYLNQPVNVVDFTPTSPGDYTFSCSMGMYRGALHVI